MAATCAMPPPICPAPITPIVLIVPVIVMQSRRDAPFTIRPSSYVALQGRRAGLVRPAPPLSFAKIAVRQSERLFKLRQDREEIADQTVIGDLEDRRFLVLVDGDDDLRILHAGQMLDCT